MPAKLTDAQVAEIRARAAEGVSPVELAERFGVTRRHVDRLVGGDQRWILAEPVVTPVLDSVEDFFEGKDLSSVDAVTAETAKTVAAKLDL